MERLFRMLLTTAEMLLGTALTAASFALIIIPREFAAGGVTGFSRILVGFVPLPLSVAVLVVNMALLLLGLAFVGSAFVVKTVSVSLLFPALLEVFSHLVPVSTAEAPLLCAAAAGVMLGVGAGLILRSGASSGGFDVLAVVLNRRFNLPVAIVMNLCDAAVILMQSIGQPLPQTLCGILVITISAAIVGRIVTADAEEAPSAAHPDGIGNTLPDTAVVAFIARADRRLRRTKAPVFTLPFQKTFKNASQTRRTFRVQCFPRLASVQGGMGPGNRRNSS